MGRFIRIFKTAVFLLVLSLIAVIVITVCFIYSIIDFKPAEYLSGLISGIEEKLIYHNKSAGSAGETTGIKRVGTASAVAETIDNILGVLSNGKAGNDKTNKNMETQVQNSAVKNSTVMNSISRDSAAKNTVANNAPANDTNTSETGKQAEIVQEPNIKANINNKTSYNLSNDTDAGKSGESREIQDKINKVLDEDNTLDDVDSIYDYYMNYMNFYNLISLDGISFKDKLTGFAIASKIKISDIKKIANLVSNGITDNEIDEIVAILRDNLTEDDIRILKDILYRNIDIVAEGLM